MEQILIAAASAFDAHLTALDEAGTAYQLLDADRDCYEVLSHGTGWVQVRDKTEDLMVFAPVYSSEGEPRFAIEELG